MKPIKVTDDIYMLSVDVEDNALLFEEMWDIPKGVTLNSFIVKGEKTAIIDGVCGWDGIPETLYKLLDELEIKPDDIDYLIVNHMEPDHSGWIESFKKITDKFEIYCSPKAGDLLKVFYGQNENIHTVKTGDKLDLGGGKVLEFHSNPGVHWPDTMFTFESSTKTLFPCDMFGSFGKSRGYLFDDQFTQADFDYYFDEEIRYFSNVLAGFPKPVINGINLAKKLAPSIIAPGHGPVYRKDPNVIIKRYEDIAKYREDAPLNEVTILWSSMYGMTEKGVNFVKEVLEREGMKYNILKIPYAGMGEILSMSLRAAGLIIAAPTYENKMFPAMAATIDELARKRITPKKVTYLGSYGWAGGAKKEMDEILAREKMNWEIVSAHEFNGSPSDEDLKSIEEAVMSLINAIK